MQDTTLNTQSVLSMRGAGYYSQRTKGAKMAIDSIFELLSKSASHLPASSFYALQISAQLMGEQARKCGLV